MLQDGFVSLTLAKDEDVGNQPFCGLTLSLVVIGHGKIVRHRV